MLAIFWLHALACTAFAEPDGIDSKMAYSCPHNPLAIGVARVVEIDTTTAPKFGSRQYDLYDFLADGEIVLTFDDGPSTQYTERILDVLAQHCTRATFFVLGRSAIMNPQIVNDIVFHGHTLGSHTWSHADLSRRSADRAIDEVEMGFSALKIISKSEVAPFFRYPYLQESPLLKDYMALRKISVFSIDVNSADYKIKNSEQLIRNTLKRLRKKGKGIILLHDIQPVTANALPKLLKRLKSEGYKVVHLTPRYGLKTLPYFDLKVKAKMGKPSIALGKAPPISNIVRTLFDARSR
jgi:peptidoglycan/xylan/chitin deacetylase (PgdA/CDA1 family)